jgi:hypothetical protein
MRTLLAAVVARCAAVSVASCLILQYETIRIRCEHLLAPELACCAVREAWEGASSS